MQSAETIGAPLSAYNSFDIVGDIAITKVPKASLANAQKIAEAIMNRNKSVRAVFIQESPVREEYRLRRLVHVAGEKRTTTIHREFGCLFKVDLEKCYFSPRLSAERLRIANLVQPGETVVNMFAGVGCFSILVAKRQPTAKIYSIDINPEAVKFMEENVRLNRVFSKVLSFRGDAKEIIQTHLQGCSDRVLMPLPEKAFEYLPSAVSALKIGGGWMHLHTFEHSTKTENPATKVRQKLEGAFNASGLKFEVPLVRVVRSTGPNWWHLVADVCVSL